MKLTYTTTDGKSFSTQKEAELHEAKRVAERALDVARNQFAIAFAENMKTADGCQFELNRFRAYYYIAPGYFDMPCIQEVMYVGYNIAVDEYDKVVVDVSDFGLGSSKRYRIEELYRDRNTANIALLEQLEVWLAERKTEIDALRQEIEAALF